MSGRIICEKHGEQDATLACEHVRAAAWTKTSKPVQHRFVQIHYSGSRLFQQCRLCTDCIQALGIKRWETLELKNSSRDSPAAFPKFEPICSLCLDEYERIYVPHSFEFELSEGQQKQLYDAVKTLRYGDSMDAARLKLGEPDYERTLFNKKKVINTFVAHIIHYHVKCVSFNPHLPNAYDRGITLYFDIKKNLEILSFAHIEPFCGEVIKRNEFGKWVWTETKPPQ